MLITSDRTEAQTQVCLTEKDCAFFTSDFRVVRIDLTGFANSLFLDKKTRKAFSFLILPHSPHLVGFQMLLIYLNSFSSVSTFSLKLASP